MPVKTFTDNTVLTASDTNTFLTNGGLVYITTGTASAASSLSINSCFTSTYENYFLVWNGSSSVNDVVTNIRLRVSGTDATTGYRFVQIQTYVGLASPAVSGSNAAGAIGTGTLSNQNTGLQMYIYNPQMTRNTICQGTSTNVQSGGTVDSYTFNGFLFNNTSYDGVTFYPNSGNITGTLRVFGVRQA